MVALYSFFVSIAVVTTQFYVFSSGVPQPSYLFYLAFVVLYWLSINGSFTIKSQSPVKYALYFLGYVTVVNVIFAILEQDWSFNSFSVYLLYDVIVFIFIVAFIEGGDRQRKLLFNSFVIALVLIFITSLLGYGRYNYYPRYNAFFNDPNQMAFWVICTFASLCLITEKYFGVKFVLFLVASFVVLKTMSRSGFIALVFVFMGVVFSYYESYKNSSSIFSVRNVVIFLSCLVLFPTIAVMFLESEGFADLVSRFEVTDFAQQSDIRGYTRIFEYPEYLLFGSGQGLDQRFGAVNEIHSTWAAFLCYYGIIGLSLFCTFLFFIYRKMHVSNLLIALSPLMYSFSTFGARTPVFWVFLAVAYCCRKK